MAGCSLLAENRKVSGQKSAAAKQMDMRQKYEQVKQQCMQQVAQRQAKGYNVVYTDGLAKGIGRKQVLEDGMGQDHQ